jgi:hypothetical protein
MARQTALHKVHHDPRSQHFLSHNNCLHLWRHTLKPPNVPRLQDQGQREAQASKLIHYQDKIRSSQVGTMQASRVQHSLVSIKTRQTWASHQGLSCPLQLPTVRHPQQVHPR